MATSLYDGLEDVELEKKSSSAILNPSSWVLGQTAPNKSIPTGIGRMVAESTSSSLSADNSTSLKLMQSHMAAKRAQGKRGVPEASRSIVAPVVDLQRRTGGVGEGTFRFNQMTGKVEKISVPRHHHSHHLSTNSNNSGSGLLYGEPNLSLGIADEYNPFYPNDFDEISKQKREKRKADERAMANARMSDHNSSSASGMCRRPANSDSGSDSDLPEAESSSSRRKRRSSNRHSSHRSTASTGAAIAPPSSLLKDVIIAPDISQPPPELPESGNQNGLNDAEMNAAGGKFGINVVAVKMMARMGYRKGQGLGRESQGMSSALVVEKTSRRGGKIIHERDRQKTEACASETEIQPNSLLATPIQIPVNATKVVLLRNMCDPGEVDDDLEPETAEECAKYGPVVTCMIFELPDAGEEDPVRIFVEFEEVVSAVKAVVDLNGRFFGGRVVKAGFYDTEKFRNLELTDPPFT